MKDLYKIEECRSCSSKKLIPIISLGDQYVVNFLDSDKNEGIKCPLNLILCNDCKLLQLEHNAPPESMWNDQYWYKSGINKMIKTYEYRKIAGGPFSFINEEGIRVVVRKGDPPFKARENMIPKSFLNMFEKLEEIKPIVIVEDEKEPIKEPVFDGPQYEVVLRSPGFYDVLHVIKRTRTNDKAMRKDDAIVWCEQMNESTKNK